MSIQVIACLNPFSQEKTEFEFEQGISVQEIIKKIDALNAVNTGWRVMIDDEIISDFEKIPEEGQKVYIKVVPEGDKDSAGTGMKVGGWLLSAVGVVMCFTPLAPLGAALLGAGVGLIAGGQTLLSMELPNMELPNMDSTKTENDPSLRGSRNQMRQYGVVPVLLGRRRIYADLGSKYYTKVEDGSVYLYQLFCAGQKDLAIDENSFKIEETSVVEYSSTKDITKICTQTSPEQSEETDKLFYIHIVNDANFYYFDKCCNEMQINSELKHTTDSGEDGSVVRTTPDGVTELNVDIFFYNGLGKYDDKGHFDPRSVTVEAYFKKADEPDSAYQILGYWNGSNTIRASSHKTLRYSITRDGLVPAAYTVKVTRVTGDSSDTKIVDAVYVGSIRGFKPEPCVRTEIAEKLTLIEVKIKASEKINNVVDSLNFVATSILPNARTAHPFQNKRQSRNPADALRYVLQGSMAQQQLDDSEIDHTPLSRLAGWCNTNGYECNAYLTERLRISDLLARIASTCRAEVLRINGKVTVIQDVQQDSEIQLFTPRNSWGYTEVMALGSIPDKMCLKFPDEENGFAENELNVYNTPDGNYEEEPATSQDVTLWGVTNSEQARKIGMYKYAVLKHRFVIVKFSCDFEYLMCRKGDLIKYAGDIALAGLKQGRIVSVQGTLLITDEEITMEAGKSYAVRIRHKDGTASLHSLVTSAVTSNALRSAEGVWSQDFEGCLFAFGLSGNETIDLIVTDIQCGDDVTAELTCVEYRPEIFNVDSPDFVLPDYVNKLSPVESVVDPGAVSGWRTFTTYNDSESEPQKPTKDGTENGWHLQQTENSKWVSTKTSATIYTGSWSAPVATGKKVMDLLVPEGEIGNPDTPTELVAKAVENGIELTWNPISVSGLRNGLKRYIVEISKDSGETWTVCDMVYRNNYTYVFKRTGQQGEDVDGYPEEAVFATWKFRIKAENIFGKLSEYSTLAPVNTDAYGTWIIPEVVLSSETVDRTLIITAVHAKANKQLYGTTKTKVRVKCLGNTDPAATGSINSTLGFIPDNTFYEPEFNKTVQPSATGNTEGNYKKNSDTPYETLGDKITQTVPLIGQTARIFKEGNVFTGTFTYEVEDYVTVPQNPNEGDIIHFTGNTTDDFTHNAYYLYNGIEWEEVFSKQMIASTTYEYEIVMTNESGYTTQAETIQAVALGTNITDIVHSHEHYKELYVEKLSVISEDVGLIKQGGMGDFKDLLNCWALSDLSPEESGTKEGIMRGTFRVGDDKEYFRVTPQKDPNYPEDISKRSYKIELKAGNIELTTNVEGDTALDFQNGTYVYNAERTIRLKLSPEGVCAQKYLGTDKDWTDRTKIVDVSKLMIDDKGNLVLTNSSNPIDFGIKVEEGMADIYHFDSDETADEDESGNNTQNITCNGVVGSTDDLNPILLTTNSPKCFHGEVTKDISQYEGKVLFLSKSTKISTGNQKINLETGAVTTNADIGYNATAKETSTVDNTKTVGEYLGLSTAQVNSNIFKVAEV